MPTKPLDRLMFAQGGLCYFCNLPLPKDEASVEHLVPIARAGSNSDDNCVACCKTMNGLLGCMSLKEKIKVVLNQRGQFKCPNGNGVGVTSAAPVTKAQPSQVPSPAPKAQTTPAQKPVAKSASLTSTPSEATKNRIAPETIAAVIANLKVRGNARPRRVKTLTSTIKSLAQLKLNDKQVSTLIDHLRVSGKITITGEQVAYKL